MLLEKSKQPPKMNIVLLTKFSQCELAVVIKIFITDLHFKNRMQLFQFLHIIVKNEIKYWVNNIFSLFFSQKSRFPVTYGTVSGFDSLQDTAVTSTTKAEPSPV